MIFDKAKMLEIYTAPWKPSRCGFANSVCSPTGDSETSYDSGLKFPTPPPRMHEDGLAADIAT